MGLRVLCLGFRARVSGFLEKPGQLPIVFLIEFPIISIVEYTPKPCSSYEGPCSRVLGLEFRA